MVLEQVLAEVERTVPVERLVRPAVEGTDDVVEVFLGVHRQVQYPWAGTEVAGRWYSRRCRAARDCAGRGSTRASV